MATHDYIISNASGAAVRADLNNALAAIVSNNSNASSPSTTYAYQWWADTTTGQLKLRNSANSAWITIFELDGTMLMENGSASSPGLAFASDLNTGFFRSAADKINFATGGVERLEIGSSAVVFNDGSNDVDFRVESNSQTHMLFVDSGNDAVGIGTSSVAGKLHVYKGNGARNDYSTSADGLVIENNSDTGISIDPGAGNSANIFFPNAANHSIGQISHDLSTGELNLRAATFLRFSGSSNTERTRIDSSGRLLVGTSTARANFLNGSVTALTQVEGSGSGTTRGTLSLINNASTEHPATFVIGRSNANTIGSNTLVANDDWCGRIAFSGNDGSEFVELASVSGFVDGTPGANDMPGRLVFSTCADGASSPSERLRIDSSGVIDFTGPGYTAGSNSCFIKQDSSGEGYLFNRGNNDLLFGTNNSERMRIDSSGRLLLGLTSSIGGGALLQVQGSGNRKAHFHQPDTGSCLIQFTNSVTGTATTDGLIVGLDSTEDGLIFVQEAKTLNFGTNNTERMRLDSSGKLLVGASSARTSWNNATIGANILQVEKSGNGNATALSITANSGTANNTSALSAAARLLLGRTRGTSVGSNTVVAHGDVLGDVSFQGNDGSGFVEAASIQAFVDGPTGANDMPGRLVFSTTADGASSPTDRMRINRTGELAMMCQANNYNLFISNASTAGTTYRLIDGRYGSQTAYSGTTSFIVFTNGNVQNTNNSYGQISDQKLKENIVDANSQWNNIKDVRVRNFNFIEGQTHTQIGVVAQELEAVSPGLIDEAPDRDEEGNDLGTVTKSVKYSVLYMKAVKALQEAMERIETLETKVAALEAG